MVMVELYFIHVKSQRIYTQRRLKVTTLTHGEKRDGSMLRQITFIYKVLHPFFLFYQTKLDQLL